MRNLILLCLAAFTYYAEAQDCAADAAQKAADAALSLQATLLASTVPSMDTDVPEQLRSTLHNFKQALIYTAEETMRCSTPSAADASQIQASLASLLHANLPQKPSTDVPEVDNHPGVDRGTYGTDLNVGVKVVPNRPDLISIQLRYGIECGDDNLLLLYSRVGGGWRSEVIWQNPDLKSISDAFGDFFLFSLVPSDPTQPYLLAVAHGEPWCTSNMSGIKIDLVAPAASGKPQQHLAHRDELYFRPDVPHLKLTSKGFELRATVYSRDMDRIMRPGVFRYRTTSGAIERIQPIANNARDFVDEWLQIPWTEAARWSAQPPASLEAAHDRFDYKLHTNGGGDSIGSYGPVRACTSAKGLFQIEIDLDSDSKLYAKLRQSPTAFTMVSISPQLDRSCIGPDI